MLDPCEPSPHTSGWDHLSGVIHIPELPIGSDSSRDHLPFILSPCLVLPGPSLPNASTSLTNHCTRIPQLIFAEMEDLIIKFI